MSKPASKGQKAPRGRPQLVPGAKPVRVQVLMTPCQADKFKRLGGAAWVRNEIEKAKEPTGG